MAKTIDQGELADSSNVIGSSIRCPSCKTLYVLSTVVVSIPPEAPVLTP